MKTFQVAINFLNNFLVEVGKWSIYQPVAGNGIDIYLTRFHKLKTVLVRKLHSYNFLTILSFYTRQKSHTLIITSDADLVHFFPNPRIRFFLIRIQICTTQERPDPDPDPTKICFRCLEK